MVLYMVCFRGIWGSQKLLVGKIALIACCYSGFDFHSDFVVFCYTFKVRPSSISTHATFSSLLLSLVFIIYLVYLGYLLDLATLILLPAAVHSLSGSLLFFLLQLCYQWRPCIGWFYYFIIIPLGLMVILLMAASRLKLNKLAEMASPCFTPLLCLNASESFPWILTFAVVLLRVIFINLTIFKGTFRSLRNINSLFIQILS